MSRRPEAKRREENEIEFSRIVAFSDGVFAIAITLLVLSLNVDDIARDDLWGGIWDLRENLLAYAISFAVIGRFWLVHHRFFGEVTAFDPRLLWLNMLYLSFIVLIPFSSQLLGDFGGETPSVVVYAANLIACILVGMWMFLYAQGAGLTSAKAESRRETVVRAAYITAVFGLSIPLAFVAPSLAPLLWLALFYDPGDRYAADRG
jgi:uncharacterized membrane protein